MGAPGSCVQRGTSGSRTEPAPGSGPASPRLDPKPSQPRSRRGRGSQGGSRHRAKARTPKAPAAQRAALTTQEQSWHSHPHCLSCDKQPESHAPSKPDAKRPRQDSLSRVTGWGPQAQAALVDALLEAGEPEIAGAVAACGAMPLPGASNVTVHSRGDGSRHMGGLCHCGRFQCCPVCTPYLMARRLEAIAPLAARIAGDGDLRHFMVVLSLRHHLGADWKILVQALRKMQAALRQGHRWKDAVVGFIRLLESTHGRNGHHPHEHLLVSLRVSEGFDVEGFFGWVREVCERHAKKAGRSCDFQDGWWSEIPRERLIGAVGYLGSADKMGTILEEFSTTTKHQPLWCIPPKAFAQVWRGSKGMRWFGVGGCWKSQATEKTDEELDEERETVGQVLAHVPIAVWKAWTPRERRDRRAVVSDRSLTDAQILEFLVACGAVAGPPPDPWGEEAPDGFRGS